jgi:hypothetical protein
MTGMLRPSDYYTQFSGSTRPVPRHAVVDAARTSPLDWMRTRRAEREQRRLDAAHERAVQRMEALGRDWRAIDLKEIAGQDPFSFLAIGPGGIFAVTVKDHGRAKVYFAGDVVQIDGRRPKYVDEARRNAKLASAALSRIAGLSIPVIPVLAFAGSGVISVYGMPKGCIVTSYRELSRVLNARGQRLAPTTVDKIYTLACQPTTWVNERYVPMADRYRWYPEGTGSTDKTSADNTP